MKCKISNDFWNTYKAEFKKDLNSLIMSIEKYNNIILKMQSNAAKTN